MIVPLNAELIVKILGGISAKIITLNLDLSGIVVGNSFHERNEILKILKVLSSHSSEFVFSGEH